MPRQVGDLFACWRGLYDTPQRMVIELKSFFFNTLYLWAAALDFPNVFGFLTFLDFFSLFLVKCFCCKVIVYLGCIFYSF
jgi:hypothetical protein